MASASGKAKDGGVMEEQLKVFEYKYRKVGPKNKMKQVILLNQNYSISIHIS